MKHKFEAFFESWAFDKDTSEFKWNNYMSSDDPKEEAFYDKYDHILNKMFDSDGNLRTKFTGTHPEVVVYLKAIEDGVEVPRSFKVGFTGPEGIKRGVMLLRKLLKNDTPKEKFPEEIVQNYLTYGTSTSLFYKKIREMFADQNPIANKYAQYRKRRKEFSNLDKITKAREEAEFLHKVQFDDEFSNELKKNDRQAWNDAWDRIYEIEAREKKLRKSQPRHVIN